MQIYKYFNTRKVIKEVKRKKGEIREFLINLSFFAKSLKKLAS